MNIPDPEHLDRKLFHSVNQIFKKDGFIFYFHPNHSQHAREIVAGLLVFLKGIWHGLIDSKKFNKFFSSSALERLQEAWWDLTEYCVITKADWELELLATNDKDLVFKDTPIVVDVAQVTQAGASHVGTGLLSTGSVSTFQTMATNKPLPSWRMGSGPTQSQLPSTSTTVMDNQVSMYTGQMGITQSDPEIKQLLICLLKALQPPTPLSTQGSTSGQKPSGPSWVIKEVGCFPNIPCLFLQGFVYIKQNIQHYILLHLLHFRKLIIHPLLLGILAVRRLCRFTYRSIFIYLHIHLLYHTNKIQKNIHLQLLVSWSRQNTINNLQPKHKIQVYPICPKTPQ